MKGNNLAIAVIHIYTDVSKDVYIYRALAISDFQKQFAC